MAITCSLHQNFPIDFDKIYIILKKLESLQLKDYKYKNFEELEISIEQLVYYLLKMKEAELVTFNEMRSEGTLVAVPFPEITMEGHEYLKNMSNAKVRKNVKAAAKKMGEIPFHIVKHLAKTEVMKLYESLL